MSLDIITGVLDGHPNYQSEFDRINAFLKSVGLPEHHEPSDTAQMYVWPIKSSYVEFCTFADDVEKHSDYRFPHLLEASGTQVGLFLPQPFPDPLVPGPEFDIASVDTSWASTEGAIGSSYSLYKECSILAKILGFYDEITDSSDAAKRLNKQCGFDDAAEYSVPDVKIPPRTAGPQTFTLVEDCCQKFYTAAKLSLQMGTAIFIS